MIWGNLYSNKSSTDKGTLFQIKNLVNHTSVPNDPKNNVQSTEDFLQLVLVAYIIVAAEKEYCAGMKVEELADVITRKYVQLTPLSSEPKGTCL